MWGPRVAKPKPKAPSERIADYADKVARGAQLAALDGVLDTVRRGERDEQDFEAVKAAAVAKIEREWHGPQATRLSLTVDNAVRQAMNAGRIGELVKAKDARPYWLFSAILDDLVSEMCFEADGTCLPSTHRWWATRIPALHLRCRSSIVSLTAAQARTIGITTSLPSVEADEGFGTMGDLLDFEERPGQYEAGTLDGVHED